jgi:hypothetical protein
MKNFILNKIKISFICPVLFRWEKLSGSSWIEIAMDGGLLRQIGNSLVSESSKKNGHYRCRSGGSSKEFEVGVSEPLSVKVTINQAKSQLESTTELTCTVTSSSLQKPSVVWLKDSTNLINLGSGRIRFLATNILQVGLNPSSSLAYFLYFHAFTKSQ